MSTEASAIPARFNSEAQRSRVATIGMWVFLATELMFFGPMFFGYTFWRIHYPDAFAAASRHTDVLRGTLNTAVLLSSSASMAMAVACRRAGLIKGAMRLLLLTALLGLAFMTVKGIEYVHDFQEHLFPSADFSFPGSAAHAARIFYWLYFAMTGLHALHLAIGIVLVAVFSYALHSRREGFASAERIEIAGLYWHFVDLVWIFLYPILYLVGRNGG